ncbi:MAG: hypothetical protein IJO17_02035, partial [Alistipes sp.]|nr:hypothetical protein [Alistipes sp.]
PKSPFNPPKGGFSSSQFGIVCKQTLPSRAASVGKGGLGRFAPGAQIFRVSWLRSTANAVKIAKLKANKSLHTDYSVHCFVVKSMQMRHIVK